MKAIYWNEEDMGTTFEEKDITRRFTGELCNKYREEWLKLQQKLNEKLMDNI